ncbi:hypothetical protein L596_019814 [Steinernema carpocapsae]|uniref:Mitochondrial fission factor n=1 Tax=Steinernema carpocapsae TaxID=34508 RepID=A0A4U5MRM7_STECR|nr:hypothetical protein L596_019814 [Steinernema carpocapsae]
MHVPEHIFVPGDSRSAGGYVPRHEANALNSATIVEEMKVPDRILVAGGGTTRGLVGQPNDVLQDHRPDGSGPDILANPPEQLTLKNCLESPRILEDKLLDESSIGSIAIDENPIQELKNMRRQHGKLSTRVDQLEDENERRKNREYGIFITVVVSIGIIVGFIVL